jgi:hypothetical protein
MADNPDYGYILHHLGEDALPFNAVSPPIFQTSNFCFESFEGLQAGLTAGEQHFIYSRGNNPTANLGEGAAGTTPLVRRVGHRREHHGLRPVRGPRRLREGLL